MLDYKWMKNLGAEKIKLHYYNSIHNMLSRINYTEYFFKNLHN